MYAADELLTQEGVRVNVFEKLPTPYGLVRAGVAPDHQTTKRVTGLFDRIAAKESFVVVFLVIGLSTEEPSLNRTTTKESFSCC